MSRNDTGHLLVVVPLVVDVLLCQLEQLLGMLGIGPSEHGEARLLHRDLLERHGRLAAVQLERMPLIAGQPRIVAVQRPEAGLDDVLLMGHAGRHVDALGDAVAVGQDQRRPG